MHTLTCKEKEVSANSANMMKKAAEELNMSFVLQMASNTI